MQNLNGYMVPASAVVDTLPLAMKYPNERDKYICFDPEPHVYYLYGERVPISVTGVIGRVAPHFDEIPTIHRMIKRTDFPIADKYAEYRKYIMWVDTSSPEILLPWIPGRVLTGNRDLVVLTIQQKWEENRVDAADRGTFMHLCAEYMCNGCLEDLWDIPDWWKTSSKST